MNSILYLVLLPVVIGINAETETKSRPNPQDASPKQWAVLIAGSNGWWNYRHQADVCHAYQILHAHGIPDERIIVMMYDDIAHNENNTTPGVIINHPDGPNVYKNVPKDYTGTDVSPANFINVLTGNASAVVGIGSGRVLQSGPNDHVFVYFVDHGSQGAICFPNDDKNDSLSNQELSRALIEMHTRKMFAKLVFYMEACYSGSMFNTTSLLPDDINIYATTAASWNEPSYLCYYSEKLDTFLGDMYSVAWMEDSDKENLRNESLEHQYLVTKRATYKSHVQEYGNLTMGVFTIAQFQGAKTAPVKSYPKVPCYAVEATEVPLVILKKRLAKENDDLKRLQIQDQINELLEKRSKVKSVFESLALVASGHDSDKAKSLMEDRVQITQLDCHTTTLHSFGRICIKLGQNPYALKYMHVLVNMCENGMDTNMIIDAMHTVCDHMPKIMDAN